MIKALAPTDARFDAMPRNTIQYVSADIVGNADELPSMLLNLIKHTPQTLVITFNDITKYKLMEIELGNINKNRI